MTQNYTRICVFEEDDFGQWICTEQELFNHLTTLNVAECPIEKIPTDVLYWAIEPSLTDVWSNDLLYHFERMRNVDYHYPIVIYNTQVIDGVHSNCASSFTRSNRTQRYSNTYNTNSKVCVKGTIRSSI